MSLLNRLKAWWGPSESAVQKVDLDKADLEVPRYPPFMKGLPAVAPQRLIDSQNELLVQLDRVVTVNAGLYEKHYKAVLHRFASYCHLLPASQGHHHRGAGGLLRHSIEVGLWAAQASDKLLLDLGKTPAQRRQIEPRWQATAFIAGLCHDIGKPATDIVVTSADRIKVWKPLSQNLSDWAAENKLSSYFLDWKQGRAKQHIALSTLLAERIVGVETLAWIEEGGTELIVWLMEALNANPGARNPLYDLVVKADQASVDRDMKTLGVAMAGYEIGVPVERHLTDIMRRLIKEGVWSVNVPGARVWNIDGAIFVVWPAAGDEIARLVREDGIPGIPRTGDGILDMLVERQLAFVRDSEDGERLWKIAPEVLVTKDGKQLTLSCIRLKNDAMIASSPLHAVHGSVLNGAGAQQACDTEQAAEEPQEAPSTEASPTLDEPAVGAANEPEAPQQPASKPKKPKPAQGKAPQETADTPPVKPDAPRPPPEMVVDQDTGEILAMKVTQADGTQRELKMRKGELAGEGKKGLSSPVALRLKPKADDAEEVAEGAPPVQPSEQPQGQQGDLPPGAGTQEAAPKAKAKSKSKGVNLSQAPTMQFTGAVGAMFQAIIDDLKNGTKRWDVDARLDEEVMVHLKWPMAFAGYGLSPKNILDECSQKKWLWVDPYAPLVRLVDSTFEGAPSKALRLNPEASYAFIHMAGYNGQAAAPNASKPPRAEPPAAESRVPPGIEPHTISADDGPPPFFDDLPPPDMLEPAPEYLDAPPAFQDASEAPATAVMEKSGPAVTPAPNIEPGKGTKPALTDAASTVKQPVASATDPQALHRQKDASPQKTAQAQADVAQRGQKPRMHQGGGRSTEPLPNKHSFQATKYDKFMAIIAGMEGVPREDGWVSFDRVQITSTCKANGLEVLRKDLNAFAEYNVASMRIEGATILMKRQMQ